MLVITNLLQIQLDYVRIMLFFSSSRRGLFWSCKAFGTRSIRRVWFRAGLYELRNLTYFLWDVYLHYLYLWILLLNFILYHHHHHQHHHYLLLLLPRYTPFRVWDWPWGQCIACQLFKRGDWVGYTQSTLLPQQLLGRTVAWAIEPAFHWWGLVGQFATGHRHLPQFWISAKSITINLGAVSLCARSPPRGLQPWASHHHYQYHHHIIIIIIIIINIIIIIIISS